LRRGNRARSAATSRLSGIAGCSLPERGDVAENIEYLTVEALGHLAPPQLGHASLRAGFATFGQARQCPQIVELEGPGLDERLSQFPSRLGIIQGAIVVRDVPQVLE
jgi:hypothetical protein